MKKWLCGCLAVLCMIALMPGMGLADDFYNPSSPLTDAKALFKQYTQNKFAFAEDWNGKRVIVAGYVEKVDEGRIDGLMGEGPKVPYVMLKGLFHAFINNPEPELKLSNIRENDGFIFDCRDLQAGDAGLYLQGICTPVMQTRKDGDQTTMIYLSKNPDARAFTLSEATLQKLESQGR